MRWKICESKITNVDLLNECYFVQVRRCKTRSYECCEHGPACYRGEATTCIRRRVGLLLHIMLYFNEATIGRGATKQRGCLLEEIRYSHD